VIVCVTVHVQVEQGYVSRKVLILVQGYLNFTTAHGMHGNIHGKYVQL